MALDQEYYEKALVILQSKGFSDKEADQVATTLSVFLPMRFIQASAWEEMPVEHRPENAFAVTALGWYDRIPELRKPIIYKMPTDLTYTTYGQEYEPGADSPVYKTGPDGYTHHPVGWKSGIAGVSGIAGPSGPTFKYQLPPEAITKQIVVKTTSRDDPAKVEHISLDELLERIGGFDKLPVSAQKAISELATKDTGVSMRLPGGVSEEQAEHLKLNNLGDIEGIKRAYPNITDAEAERLSSMHRTIARRASAFSNPERQPSLFERLMDPDRFARDIKDDLNRLHEKAGPRCVDIQSSFKQVLGGGLVIETPLFGQRFKRPTGPQTMPGLEKGPNGKPHRRKKGKGKRYERGY